MSVSQEQAQKQPEGPPKWRSIRFLVSYMGAGGLMVLYIQRVSMSLAIVCMVNHTALYHQGHQVNQSGGEVGSGDITTTTLRWTNDLFTRSSGTPLDHSSSDQEDRRCARPHHTKAEPNSKEDGPFVWDKRTQGLILAALYIGYTIGQVPASMAISRYGVRLTTFTSYMVMSLSHALCHPAALLSPWAVFTLRIIVGFCNGCGLIPIYAVWRKWAPSSEQSQLIGISFCGEMVGSFAVFPLTAFLCRYGFLDGWPSIFYVFGGVGVAWSVAWLILVRDSPETHPRISPEEQRYIVTTRADVTKETDNSAVPWCSILRSPCFWAFTTAHYVYVWGLFLMLSVLPTFLYETMHFDIQSNGLYSMLPYIAMFVTVSGSGFICDAVIERRYLSKLAVRKLTTFLASVVPGVLLVAMSHMECHQTTLVVVLLTVAVGLSGLAMSGGFLVNAYDLAPRFSFYLFTFSNTVATTSGIVSPYLVAVITADRTREQWQAVFHLTGALYFVGTAVYFVLGRADLQPWAYPETEIEVPAPSEEPDETTAENSSHASQEL